MNVRTWLKASALMLFLLLAAVASSQADEVGIVTSGRAFTFDRVNRGFVRIIGDFVSVAPLNLGASGIHATIDHLLLEADDPGVSGAGGGDLVPVPIHLFPRIRSQRVTVFETTPGTTPFARLYVRTCIPTQEGCPTASGLDVHEYHFQIDAVNITVNSPDQCGTSPASGPTEISTRFTIDDGVSPPVSVLVDKHPWNCVFRNGQPYLIQTP